MTILLGRSERETIITLGGTWLVFVAALCFALPQPPRPLHVAIGATIGAVLTVVGFGAASRNRTIPPHSPRGRAKLGAIAMTVGAILGAALLSVLVALAELEPALRGRFAGRLSEPWWRPWALGLESSVLEEVTFRLFAMSVLSWLAMRLLRNQRASFAIALIVSALLFGLAHLPAWSAATQVSATVVGAVLVLNGAGGVILGWFFWRLGLPYAIACHLVADVVVQGLGPKLLA